MQLDVVLRRLLLIFTLLSLPVVVGSSCVVLFNSGGGSSDNDDSKDDEDEEDEELLIVKSGSFVAPAVQGLNYESGTLKGITGEDGEFQYEDGSAVQFAIGEVKLGTAVSGKATITPQDLVLKDTCDEVAAFNMARLLVSLDSDQSDQAVTISPLARAKAVRSNTSVSATIDFLDYCDEQSFVNAASQLLATLTEEYAFTATLVDAEDVRARLIDVSKGGNDQ